MRKDFLNRNPIVLEIRARIAKQDYTELKKKKKASMHQRKQIP
jgi:hypothetical protein